MNGFVPRIFLSFLILLNLLGCSFDYGDGETEDSGLPDIVMDDVEYVRVRDGDPQVRFRAERAERYENKQLMELRNFTFEQFGHNGEDIDSAGSAASARVELESGDIGLSGGVSMMVDSEDITIETGSLDWKDKERQLSGNPEAPVWILRDDGTNFQGQGFTANARTRTWGFTGPIGGTYVDEDDDEEDEDTGEAEDGEAENSDAVETSGEEAGAEDLL